MQKIALIGSAALAERINFYLEQTGFAEVIGYFDDFEAAGTLKYEKPILGPIADAAARYRKGDFDAALIAIGYEHLSARKALFEDLSAQGMPFATYVHPTARIEEGVTVGAGSIVLVQCTVDFGTKLGDNVFLSSRTFVSHHVNVGAHSYIAPSVNLAGHTAVGECCFIGVGTTSVDGVRIGDFVRSAAGAVIASDAPGHSLVVGVPAKVKKQYKD